LIKNRYRRLARLSPLHLVTVLPAAGMTLLSHASAARAQNAPDRRASTDNDAAGLVAGARPQGTLGGQAAKVPDTQATNELKIGEIIVIGNKSLSKDYIIIASGAKIGAPCGTEALVKMKVNLLQTGLFGTHVADPEQDGVKVTAEDNPAAGTCKVVIVVDENDTIQNINLTGTGPIKVEDVKALLHFKVGSVYSIKQLARDANDIQDLYSRKGYIVTLTQEADVDDKGVLNVPLQVTRLAEIKIVGAHKTRRSVILRNMNSKVGDYYNINTSEADRRRLLNLDLFDDVKPSEYTIGPGRIGLTLNVIEKRTGTVTAGVGYSSRAQLIGFAEVAETNFRGLGETLSLRGEVGGIAGRPSIELGFNEPYLDHKRTALNVQLYDKVVYRFSNSLTSGAVSNTTLGTTNRYNEQRAGSTVTLSRPFGHDSFRASVSVRAEYVTTNPLELPYEDASILQNGSIFVLGTSLLHNTRDLDLDPVSGGFQTLSLQVGTAHLTPVSVPGEPPLPGIFGQANFFKVNLDARQYISLSGPRRRDKPTQEKTIIAVRTILGTSAGTLPFFEQFFVGGGDSLRGYRDDRFWGSNLFLTSAELRYPLAPKFKGVLFADLGDAWGGEYKNIVLNGFTQDGFHLHLGVGLGIRVITPIGPLRLDYGFGDEGGLAHFSIGQTF